MEKTAVIIPEEKAVNKSCQQKAASAETSQGRREADLKIDVREQLTNRFAASLKSSRG